jgi:FixJ family two-component response regulator
MSLPSPTGRATVFVIDNDEAVCRALELALDLEGFDVVTRGAGEALLLCDLPPRDAFLVIDERLPGISGLEALKQLRGRGVRLPAVMITSHPNPHFRRAAADMGVDILEKPLMGETLIAAVRKGLREAASDPA